jgi:glycerol-3-phosphate acyltransferase PlsY
LISIGVTVALAYLLGSISPSIAAGRIRGLDIRRHGSGNAGLTNVVRVLGWKYGLGVAIVDVGKGFVAVWALPAILLDPAPGPPSGPALAAGLAVIAGHIWPIFSGFRGGKGVATGAGTLLAVSPWAWVGCTIVFAGILRASRRVSLASLAAAAAAPLSVAGVDLLRGVPVRWEAVGFCIAAAALIFWAHRSNIARLQKGTEPRVGPGSISGT